MADLAAWATGPGLALPRFVYTAIMASVIAPIEIPYSAVNRAGSTRMSSLASLRRTQYPDIYLGLMDEYTGTEQAMSWSGTNADPGAIYVVRPPGLPPGAVPLYDDESEAIVGFRTGTSGVYNIYDLDGNNVGMYEEPLQTPLFDPIDLIFIFGGLFRSLGKAGVGVATRRAAAGGMRGLVVTLGRASLPMLRASVRQVLAGELKFTATTAARMAIKARYVPLHILKLAVRHGKRVPDPQGVIGAFEYTIPMTRNGVAYTLKVVLREADNTILHFHYFK